MTVTAILDDTKSAMEKSLQHLTEVLRSVRTARASSALVDNIRVEYYGTQTPINQLAAVSIPEPRQIVIKPFDASILGEIGKAIMKSDLGIQPQNDGKILRLQMPPLSGEQRQKYAAKVKEMVEEARIAMRNGRRDMNKRADADLKGGNLTEDEHRKLLERIQDTLKEYEGKLDGVQERKTAEIMEV
ncbi:MAG TPA: ribosome recycling factor [Planctomycetota bacterium]|nr:ribosome recycling factor [Planctomycetota bacterium]